MNNYELVQQGLGIVRNSLVPYEARELISKYGNAWWSDGVLGVLFEDQRRDLPSDGSFETLTDSIDTALALTLLDANWKQVFKYKLANEYRSYAHEIRSVRNKWAHIGGGEFNEHDTWRALDTMSMFLAGIDPDATEDANKLLRMARYGNEAGSVAAAGAASTANRASAEASAPVTVAAGGLPSWRSVMQPHQDVAEGRYRTAEFAADLAQVARGEGTLEYRDPVEFFSRTYVTEGMKGLLVQAIRRVSGLGGEPVIQLKTAFGGGKTHSMLALYHILRSKRIVTDIPNARVVLDAAGVSELPGVRVAVLVGTSLDPSKARRPSDMPGITINTLWGEMAAQLVNAAGDPKLYGIVRDADRKGVSPGSAALKELFDSCGPCLVLMDELVAYAKKLYGVDGMPAGSFDNFITFIQEVTEAARASKNSIVVASIPESSLEIGGEAGQIALEQIEHTFGRMEAIWKPVSANEGFEVVRRRLFLPCGDEAARDAVCNAFSKMYETDSTDFPIEAKELEYRDRMVACYPIHPEVFDRLYEDWATLERFQRTRGVLRLMAAVIHRLWMSQDEAPMIMPSSFPLEDSKVRDELTRYLDDGWNAVVDSEVDGKKSVPYRADSQNARYGKCMASRRVARAVMLGSAPDVAGQSARGIEKARVRLGVIQPGENPSIFNDALSTLKASSSYLYSDSGDNRYWYDTRPTLRKVAEDRARQRTDEDALYEIEVRLKKLRKAAPFQGIHVCPSTTLDVPDEQSLRLVVLPATQLHRAGDDDSGALMSADALLTMRGTSQRIHKNTLAFVAADVSAATTMREEAKRYLAWSSINDDRESLNLDIAQTKEASVAVDRASQTLDAKIREAYAWLLVPSSDMSDGGATIAWEALPIKGGSEDPVTRAGKKMLADETAIGKWAPQLLRMRLDNVLWKGCDHIQVKELWGYLTDYCYLDRLASFSVLEDAIRDGARSRDYFGIAGGVGDEYINLTLGEDRTLYMSDFLVRPDVAAAQIAAKAKESAEQPLIGTSDGWSVTAETQNGSEAIPQAPTSAAAQLPKTFTMTADIDTLRASRNIQAIMEEVVSQLNRIDGAQLSMRLTVSASCEDGVPKEVQRTLSENCKTLKIEDFGFYI